MKHRFLLNWLGRRPAPLFVRLVGRGKAAKSSFRPKRLSYEMNCLVSACAVPTDAVVMSITLSPAAHQEDFRTLLPALCRSGCSKTSKK
jgi:hypothetical protein